MNEEVLKIVKQIASTLSYKFRFGYLTHEDITQECYILAMQSMEKYDGVSPLENYLRVCIKNRLCSFKRDNYQRLYENKCKCDLCNDKGLSYEEKIVCKKYKMWYDKNQTRKNVLLPIGLQYVAREDNKLVEDDRNPANIAANKEVFELIDRALPVNMRGDYLKMKAGIKVGKAREEEILAKIRSLLNDRGIKG